MRIDTLRVTCGGCKHVFDAEYVVDCPVSVAAASMEAIRCPKCGSAKTVLGGNYDDAPAVSAPLATRVAWWRTRGERGTSSNTIFHAFGADSLPRDRDGKPYDPDDFRRCHQLLTLIPEWKAELGKVADRFPYWRPFTDNWAAMEALFIEELPSGRAPKLYALMKDIEKQSDEIRKGR